jgi:hypothetical protein
MKKKPVSKNQALKTSFKAPLIQQMPYKKSAEKSVKSKVIDKKFMS